jgi:alpha-glucuronidase
MDMSGRSYKCWLQYAPIEDRTWREEAARCCAEIVSLGGGSGADVLRRSALDELKTGLSGMLGTVPRVRDRIGTGSALVLATAEELREAGIAPPPELERIGDEGFVIRTVPRGDERLILLAGRTGRGVLYAAYRFLALLAAGGTASLAGGVPGASADGSLNASAVGSSDISSAERLDRLDVAEAPVNGLRMINHWDNMDGSIERGYAGRSIFYRNHRIVDDLSRVRDYARLLASVGINAISINNVNVHDEETKLITDHLPDVARVADVFRAYGIRLFLSINFASPVQIGGLPTADPLDPDVRRWWAQVADNLYRAIPDFGGFLVKADSEFRPGPFTYGRNHADGANMLADALAPHGGLVIWRCFVYNCLQDWRDRKTDRARAAYDHFLPHDGQFRENVLLQIKNGPMDFQVREPVSPLFGGMSKTNQLLELQITQEYTGQQRHLCYLVTQWKEVLDFDTHAKGPGSTVARIASGSLFNRPLGGFAGVSNIGDDENWTGHLLAQANLYGFGRLAWNPALTAEDIAREWILLTFGGDEEVLRTVSRMLLESWNIYESYTAPLGVGWMVNPGHHYGPNVDGYEYTKWGTYHFADHHGIGVDRTVRTGTGYTAQYHPPVSDMYESLDTCPDELLLFFHHVPYTHRLKSGKTVIQHIYDTHFEGAERAAGLVEAWRTLEGKMDEERYRSVLERLMEQAEHAKEWRDVINTYFYRKSGIPDAHNRTIY